MEEAEVVKASFDAHGRQSTVTDAGNGATVYTFNNADQVLTTTSPGTSTGPQAGLVRPSARPRARGA